MNRLSTDKRIQVVSALVEGNSVNAIVRMTGVAKHSVLNLLRDIGCAAAAYHHHQVRGVRVRRLQCDEIWAFCGAKSRSLFIFCITTSVAFTAPCVLRQRCKLDSVTMFGAFRSCVRCFQNQSR